MEKRPFLWGSATAAYQCEGAWNLEGKGLGEWDVFSHESPLNIKQRAMCRAISIIITKRTSG